MAKDFSIESIKADNEACLIASFKKQNKQLDQHYKTLFDQHQSVQREHAQVAEELDVKKKEWVRVSDENDALRHQANDLRRLIQTIPGTMESQSDLQTLCEQNQVLTEQHAQLQDQLADMENVLIEIKMKYALSESERERLNQRLIEVKKWMNS